MILPNTELFASLQSSITEGGHKNPELDLLTGQSQAHPVQNFEATLDQTLSSGAPSKVEKESDAELSSSDSDSSEQARPVRLPSLPQQAAQLDVLAGVKGVNTRMQEGDAFLGGVDKAEEKNLQQAATNVHRSSILKADKPTHAPSTNRQSPSVEKLPLASDLDLAKRSGQRVAASTQSEQKVVPDALQSTGAFSKVFGQASSDLIVGEGARSLLEPANSRSQAPAVHLDKKAWVDDQVKRSLAPDPSIPKFQTKHATEPGRLDPQAQVQASLKSGTKALPGLQLAIAASGELPMADQRSKNALSTRLPQQKIGDHCDKATRSINRSEQPLNSHFRTAVGDVLNEVRLKPNTLEQGADLKRSEPVPMQGNLDGNKPLPVLKSPEAPVMREVTSDDQRVKIERNSPSMERHGEPMRQFKDPSVNAVSIRESSQSQHVDTIEVTRRQPSQQTVASSDFEAAASVADKAGQGLQSREARTIASTKIDLTPPAVPLSVQKAGRAQRIEPNNQHVRQLNIPKSSDSNHRQTFAPIGVAEEAVPMDRAQRFLNRSERNKDNLPVRARLQARGESLHVISDSRQSYASMPIGVGQVSKAEASVVEESLLQDPKLAKDRSDEKFDKTTRQEARFDKQAQSGGFLENKHTQGITSVKTAASTLNQATPLLMQRMVDTIQELKHSQNAQRVSFEVDLAQGEKLKVRLQLSGDQVKSLFTTDSNTLKHLIRENWDQLQRQVDEEGFDLAQPDFADGSPQQGYDNEEQSTANASFQAELKKSASSDRSAEKKHSDHDPVARSVDEEDPTVVRYA